MTPIELQRICHDAIASVNVQAFLRVIRAGETSQGDEAYCTLVGGGRFEKFDDHPRQTITVRPGLKSTAAGAYQFLSRTWDECAVALELPDFSPPMQDLAAVFLIRRRGALDDVIAGRFEAAVMKCNREWASLPGSPYGQPTKSMAQAWATYKQYGGSVDTSPGRAQETAGLSTRQPEKPMAPFLIPAIVELAKAIPKLGGLFASSEVAQRNVKAAEVVMSAVVPAVQAANAQEAVEKIANDPEARAAAEKAVQDVWWQISEAGGGGIEGARKADAAYAAAPWHAFMHSPSFWIAIFLLPLVYMIVGNVVGLIGSPLSDEVRSAISNGVVGLILGGLIGYYYGQTTSRNRS